jgi:hypothetical protein
MMDDAFTPEEIAEFRRLAPTLRKLDSASAAWRFLWGAAIGLATLFGAWQGLQLMLHAAQGIRAQ